MTPKFAAALAMFAGSLLTVPALATQPFYSTQLNAPAGGTLTLNADIGSVSIVGRSTSQVTFRVQAEGSNSFKKRIHISAVTTPDGVRISVQADAHSFDGLFQWLHWFGRERDHVRLNLIVPSAYRLDLHTAGGDISAQDISAAVRASSAGGDTSVQNIAGTVELRTAGGDIEARNIQGAVHLDSAGGDVTLADATGDLSVHTEGGDIVIRNANGRLEAQSAGGDISAELLALHRISLSTAGGDITLRLPPDIHADLTAASAGGDVSCDFPMTTQNSGGDHLDGTIGGGGVLISLHSAGGDIHIGPRK